MNLTIKNVPEDVYKVLKRAAAKHRRSLNSQMIVALSRDAELEKRRIEMQESWDDLERFVVSLPKMPSSVPIIRRERESH